METKTGKGRYVGQERHLGYLYTHTHTHTHTRIHTHTNSVRTSMHFRSACMREIVQNSACTNVLKSRAVWLVCVRVYVYVCVCVCVCDVYLTLTLISSTSNRFKPIRQLTEVQSFSSLTPPVARSGFCMDRHTHTRARARARPPSRHASLVLPHPQECGSVKGTHHTLCL